MKNAITSIFTFFVLASFIVLVQSCPTYANEAVKMTPLRGLAPSTNPGVTTGATPASLPSTSPIAPSTTPVVPGTTPSIVPASASATTSVQPALRQTISKGSTPTAEENSVESFFQIDTKPRNNPQSLLMQPATAATKSNRNSHMFRPDRFVWHVLDNMGVPMFFGNHDSYLDPSLRESYVIPSPKLPNEKDVVKEIETSPSPRIPNFPQPTSATSESIHQKIPESELEGVPLPAPRDDVNAPSP